VTALAGYWTWNEDENPVAWCERMLRAQSLYGQETAQWNGGPIALGRRIHRHLPEDAFDRRPIVSACGEYALVADVRIDNREQIAAGLGIAGADARRLCDSELLMRAYLKWGEELLQRLVGDFAFALWNSAREELLLARDFLGRKPLYHHIGDGFLAFASMPKGLHALPQIPYALCEERAVDFLGFMAGIGPASYFDGIERVEPGHIVTVSRTGVSRRRYWRPDLSPLILPRPGDYAEALRERLDEAVESRLRGAGPAVGAHLSAGLDSSAVVSTAARHMLSLGGRVTAFTAVPRSGYDGPVPRGRLADEGPLAAAVAAQYPNVDHLRIEVGGVSPLRDLDRQFFLYERPILNLCNQIWLEAINDRARERGLSVLLTAELGNLTMSYAGEHRLAELLGQGRLLAFSREATGMLRNGHRLRGVAAAAFASYLPAGLWAVLARFSPAHNLERASAILPALARSASFRKRAREHNRASHYRVSGDGVRARVEALATYDAGNFNKGVLGGWGIDIRDPTADRRLVEYCLRVPSEHFMRGGVQRALARHAFADRLPPALLAEGRRGYQFADWHENFAAVRGDFAAEVDRLADDPFAQKSIDIERLRALVRDWPGGAGLAEGMLDYRCALARAVSVGRFAAKVRGSNRPEGAQESREA
jgi:asparagine synthase (glutamine-hydrolysing)